MIEPTAWIVKNGLVDYQLMGSKEQADALAAHKQKDHDLSGSLAAFNVQPLYTEAQLIEKHKRILWDVCQAYGKAGECVFTVFKHKVENQ